MDTQHRGGLELEVLPVGGGRTGAREATTQNGAMSWAEGGGLGAPQALLGPGCSTCSSWNVGWWGWACLWVGSA